MSNFYKFTRDRNYNGSESLLFVYIRKTKVTKYKIRIKNYIIVSFATLVLTLTPEIESLTF